MIYRNLGRQDYPDVYRAMVRFTDTRKKDDEDELWYLEHNPVYTLGRAGDPSHLLRKTEIPVIRADRGGEVTYHGPGQLIVYTMLDFARLNLAVGVLVKNIARAIILVLRDYGIVASYDPARPGVYVGACKIASLGLRIRNKSIYHGLSLNVSMDLSPFLAIDPCGYPGLVMTDMKTCLPGVAPEMRTVADRLLTKLTQILTPEY